ACGQRQGVQVAHSGWAILGFVLGVVVAAKLVGPPGERVVWSRGITLALCVEFAVLVVFAFAWWLSLPRFADGVLISLIVLSGLAMGIQSAVARRLGVRGEIGR